MIKFELDGPIILADKEKIVAELKRIAAHIEAGSTYGDLESDLQFLYWSVEELVDEYEGAGEE